MFSVKVGDKFLASGPTGIVWKVISINRLKRTVLTTASKDLKGEFKFTFKQLQTMPRV